MLKTTSSFRPAVSPKEAPPEVAEAATQIGMDGAMVVTFLVATTIILDTTLEAMMELTMELTMEAMMELTMETMIMAPM